jgi:hypothetical protein
LTSTCTILATLYSSFNFRDLTELESKVKEAEKHNIFFRFLNSDENAESIQSYFSTIEQDLKNIEVCMSHTVQQVVYLGLQLGLIVSLYLRGKRDTPPHATGLQSDNPNTIRALGMQSNSTHVYSDLRVW